MRGGSEETKEFLMLQKQQQLLWRSFCFFLLLHCAAHDRDLLGRFSSGHLGVYVCESILIRPFFLSFFLSVAGRFTENIVHRGQHVQRFLAPGVPASGK